MPMFIHGIPARPWSNGVATTVPPLNRLYVDIVAGVSELRDQLPQQRALRNVRLSDVPNAAVLPADLVDPEERPERLRTRNVGRLRRLHVLVFWHRRW